MIIIGVLGSCIIPVAAHEDQLPRRNLSPSPTKPCKQIHQHHRNAYRTLRRHAESPPTQFGTLTNIRTSGLCAGKEVVARCLVEQHGFTEIVLGHPAARSSSPDAASSPKPGSIVFSRVSELVDYVTKRWRENFVLARVQNEAVLDELSSRPFFILVSVDAPIQVRWRRYKARYVSPCLFHQPLTDLDSGLKHHQRLLPPLNHSSIPQTTRCMTLSQALPQFATAPPSNSSTPSLRFRLYTR